MADELRRRCKYPRCRRSFTSYANLVLHEQTAHVSLTVLQQFDPGHTDIIANHNQGSSNDIFNDSNDLSIIDLASNDRSTVGLHGEIPPPSDNMRHCPGREMNNVQEENPSEQEILPSGSINNHSDELTSFPTLRAEHAPDLLNFNLDSTKHTEDMVDESLPRDLHAFYKSFGDCSEYLFKNVNEIVPKLEDLPEAYQEVIRDCMRRRMSQEDIHGQYELIKRLEQLYCSQSRDCTPSIMKVSELFEDGKDFVQRVVKERRLLVKREGWRLANLRNSLGISQHGVFLPIMIVLDRIVQKAGGIDSITEYEKHRDEQQRRLFSSPIDSDVMRMECSSTGSSQPKHYRKLFFSIYCDKTLLAKSGSQDAAIIRVRADNLRHMNTEWFDIGIPPKIKVGLDPISDGKKRAAKLDLLHRFLFLILEDLSFPNHNATVQKYEFEPCLVGFVVDQPQEREFCCLKRGNCEQDCSVVVLKVLKIVRIEKEHVRIQQTAITGVQKCMEKIWLRSQSPPVKMKQTLRMRISLTK